MTHAHIVRQLTKLADKANSTNERASLWVGYARIIESLTHIAEHSPDRLQAAVTGLKMAQHALEASGPLKVKDADPSWPYADSRDSRRGIA